MIAYEYATDPKGSPPAPFVEVTIVHPETGRELVGVGAQLDTGADVTVLSTAVVEQLALEPAARIKAEGLGGGVAEYEAYLVKLAISPSRDFQLLRTLECGEPWILLGRDILNQHRIVLDGPKSRVLFLDLGGESQA